MKRQKGFTLLEFERALPVHKDTERPLWKREGYVMGEFSFTIPVKEGIQIMIRSTCDWEGNSRPYAKDSIKAYLIGTDGAPLGSKVKKYIHRSNGWDIRLRNMLRMLYRWGLHIDRCTVCGSPKSIFQFKDKTGDNYGELFTKCVNHGEFRLIGEVK